MKEHKEIAKGSFWNLSSGILTKVISFLYIVIIARLLSPEDIGLFYLVLSILGVLYIFTDLGLMYSVGRYVPYLYGKKDFGKLRNLINLSYYGGGILTLIFSVIIFFLSETIAQFIGQPQIKPILEMLAIWLFLKEIDDVNRSALNGRKKIKEARALEVIQNTMKLIITGIAFYIIGFNAEALSIGFLSSFLLVLPIGIYLVIKEMKNWKKTEDIYSLKEQITFSKEIVSFGVIVTLTTMLYSILQYTDRIMLGYFTTDALSDVAIYSIVIGMANLVLIFPGSIRSIFFPIITELFGKGKKEEMNKTIKTSIRWIIMLMIPVTLIMALFGDSLLRLFYGEIYSEGSTTLSLFIIGIFITSALSIPTNVLIAMKRLDVELKAGASAAITNIILNVILIPRYGINGAALASLISFIVLGIITWYYSKKIFNFKFPKESYKPLIAGVISFIIIFIMVDQVLFLANNYIPEIQIGQSQGQLADEIAQKFTKLGVFGLLFGFTSLIYLVSLIIMRSFGKEELDLLEIGMERMRISKKYRKMTRKILEAKYLGSH